MAPADAGDFRLDEDDDDFYGEYNPHPYQGGYNLAATFGTPLPPSSKICYPVSSSSSATTAAVPATPKPPSPAPKPEDPRPAKPHGDEKALRDPAHETPDVVPRGTAREGKVRRRRRGGFWKTCVRVLDFVFCYKDPRQTVVDSYVVPVCAIGKERGEDALSGEVQVPPPAVGIVEGLEADDDATGELVQTNVGRFHINHMKGGGNSVTTVKEKVLEPVTATLQTSSPVRGQAIHDLDDSSTFEAPPGTPPWDYFGLFQPVESQISFHDDKELGHDFENDDDIRRLREKEGIPELEEELEKSPAYPDYLKRRLGVEKPLDLKDVEKSPMNGGEDDLALSEDDFDNPTSESLVRVFKNRNDTSVAHIATGQSPAQLPTDDLASETVDSQAERPKDDTTVDPQTERLKDDTTVDPQAEKTKDHTVVDSHAEKPKDDTRELDISMYESDETPPLTSPVKEISSSTAAFPVDGKFKEPVRDVRNVTRDLSSCMKEIEILFIKASDSGKEVPRMLEADKVSFRPLLPEEKAPGSTASGFFATLFACCREEVPVPQPPPQAEVQYLTWHRSMSSLSSSSRNPLGTTSKEDTEGLTGNIFGGVYMNSGSHASTLDRLYAWERKLYDEVKASSTVCRQYDEKCRQLRHQESRGESQMSIDKTRAVVKDLHSRILVAIQRIDMISKNIEDLRDKELQPQLEELIGSLTRMWATMLDCHRHQHDIIKQVSNTGNMKASIRSESQFQATLLLQVELNTLCSNFQKWIASHKAYLQSLNSWLLKCVKSLQRKRKSSRKKKVEADPITKYAVAPIFKTCESWINLLDNLPTDLEEAIKDLAADINRYVPHQEKQRGGSKRILSLSRSVRSNREMGEVHRSEPPTDLQSSLEIFLGKLEVFSNISLQKYMELKKDINEAKERYKKAQADQRI